MYECRPIAFEMRFFNFPRRGETKKHPWDRILQFRFHATILGGLLQAAEKAGLTKVDQLRSKRVFFNFPHRGETKKHPRDRILQFRFHATILGGFFEATEEAGCTKVVQLRSKCVFSTFPVGAKRKNTLGIEFYNFGFMPPFWVGFSKQRKKPGGRRSTNYVQNAFFSTFPIAAKRKNTLGIEFYNFGFMPPFWVDFSKQRKKPGVRRSSNCVQKAYFQLSPSGRNEKTPLGSNFKNSVSRHHFGWVFQAAEKAGLTKVVQLRSKRVFSTFPIGAKRKNTLGIEFYNFGFMPPFWVGFSKQRKKPGGRRSTNYVQNAFFSTFPIGAKRKNTLGIEFYNFEFMPPFWVDFSKQRKKPGVRRSSNCVQKAYRGETKKHPSTFPVGAKRKNTLGIEF